MSENGTFSRNFHEFYDNKGPTLSIIKSKNNNIFGGFTPLNWNSNNIRFKDETNSTFLFSLNLMKKLDIINIKKYAIFCYSNNGPYFGASDLRLDQNMKKGQTFANTSCSYLSNNNLITGGHGDNEFFEVEDLEVFEVKY